MPGDVLALLTRRRRALAGLAAGQLQHSLRRWAEASAFVGGVRYGGGVAFVAVPTAQLDGAAAAAAADTVALGRAAREAGAEAEALREMLTMALAMCSEALAIDLEPNCSEQQRAQRREDRADAEVHKPDGDDVAALVVSLRAACTASFNSERERDRR